MPILMMCLPFAIWLGLIDEDELGATDDEIWMIRLISEMALPEILLQPLLKLHYQSFFLRTVKILQPHLATLMIPAIEVPIQMLHEIFNMDPVKLCRRVNK